MRDSWKRALGVDQFHMEAGVLAVLVGVEKVARVGKERPSQKARWVLRRTRFGSRNGDAV